MKKLITALFAFMLVLTACGGDDNNNNDDNSSSREDGYYHAMGETASNGWTPYVTVVVTDGKISEFNLDSVNLKTGGDATKAELSMNGEYNLAEGAVASLHEQYETIEAFVLENDGFADVTFNDEGSSDGISGATIKYGFASELLDEALANGPVTNGVMPEDGVFFGTAVVADETEWADQVAYFVDKGIIIGVHVDAAKVEEGEKVFKTDLAEEGEYELAEGAVGTLIEQYTAIEENIMTMGADFATTSFDEEGKTDAISGATISVDGFVEAFENAE